MSGSRQPPVFLPIFLSIFPPSPSLPLFCLTFPFSGVSTFHGALESWREYTIPSGPISYWLNTPSSGLQEDSAIQAKLNPRGMEHCGSPSAARPHGPDTYLLPCEPGLVIYILWASLPSLANGEQIHSWQRCLGGVLLSMVPSAQINVQNPLMTITVIGSCSYLTNLWKHSNILTRNPTYVYKFCPFWKTPAVAR